MLSDKRIKNAYLKIIAKPYYKDKYHNDAELMIAKGICMKHGIRRPSKKDHVLTVVKSLFAAKRMERLLMDEPVNITGDMWYWEDVRTMGQVFNSVQLRGNVSGYRASYYILDDLNG